MERSCHCQLFFCPVEVGQAFVVTWLRPPIPLFTKLEEDKELPLRKATETLVFSLLRLNVIWIFTD